ncbi:MAG: hypothetical protein N4A35_07255 [Flavobacteriales bacterium]|jgi:hypothetical protein|nr:hypothetical protein [Flavobacteriales bacterium]
MRVSILFFIPLFFVQCAQSQNNANHNTTEVLESATQMNDSTNSANNRPLPQESTDDRSIIVQRLAKKIINQQPLTVQLYVPLCDNENQGIVPTSASLGNGLDLKRNLYWATSKGVKRYFKELSDWKLVNSKLNINDVVLERVVYKKTFKNHAVVYLIADAYRGDEMKHCLEDFFNALSGNRSDSVIIDNHTIAIGKDADLSIFNGHNGLMDDTPTILPPKNHTPKDAAAIACVSGKYFKEYYEYTNSYPLVNTNHLLYPGAFIAEGIINQWALLGSAKDCKIAAGKSYYKHKPKSGPNGSQNLFNYGWEF